MIVAACSGVAPSEFQLNPFTRTDPTCTSSPVSCGPNAMTVAFFAWYPVAKVVTWFRSPRLISPLAVRRS